VRWSVEAAKDADAERVGRWRDRRSGGGHLRDSQDEWPVRANPSANRWPPGVAPELAEHLVTVCQPRPAVNRA
jgi:hypothetical protein